MRWERLWLDLSAQAEQAERDADLLEAADRLRVEHATIRWLDRARACTGRPLAARLSSGRSVGGQLLGCGVDWLALRTDGGDLQVLVASAVRTVAGLGAPAVAPEALGAVGRSADLRQVLRRLAAAGEPVVLGGTDGTDLRGLLGRVGRDHVDLHVEDGGCWTVPVAGVELVRLC